MDEFTKSYIRCALWSSTGDNCEPLDQNHSPSDIAPETLEQMRQDCEQFQKENAADLDEADLSRAGHDFWLTRCHHGSGFWDGDWPKKIGKALTDAAHAFGQCDIYVGDDGLLYA